MLGIQVARFPGASEREPIIFEPWVERVTDLSFRFRLNFGVVEEKDAK